MSVPGMHAFQRLLELEEKKLFTPNLPDDCTDTQRIIGSCYEAIGKGMLVVAQQTVWPEAHRNPVELHPCEVPQYHSQDNLFPNRCGEVYGRTRDVISFDVPALGYHGCDKGEHQELIKIFGWDGWWLQGIAVDVIDFRGDAQRVNVHIKLADTRRSPRYDEPFPGFKPVLNYVYLTLNPTGSHHCERFTIGCSVDTMNKASMCRENPENAFFRPLNLQASGSIDQVMGHGTEEQLLKDLQKLGTFLTWFAEENARSK